MLNGIVLIEGEFSEINDNWNERKKEDELQ